jgi:hypothetical protein
MSENKVELGFTIGSTMYFGPNKLEFQVGKQVVITMGDEYDVYQLQVHSAPLETMRDFLQQTLEIIDKAIENNSNDVEA